MLGFCSGPYGSLDFNEKWEPVRYCLILHYLVFLLKPVFVPFKIIRAYQLGSIVPYFKL